MEQVVSLMDFAMPNQTTSTRIPVSLRPDLYAVISDLAKLENKPKSRVIVELLEQMQPILEANRDALKAVKEGSDPSKILLSMFAEGFGNLGEFGDELKKALDK